MQCAPSGSSSKTLHVLAVLTLVFGSGCSLQGEATGSRTPAVSGDDGEDPAADDVEVDQGRPTGSRRDAGRDGGLDAAADARVPRDASKDAAALDAEVEVDARADATVDAHVEAGAVDAGPPCSVAGSYAGLLDFNVQWVPTSIGGVLPVLMGGSGSIRLFSTVQLDANGGAVVQPCGTTVPDFEGTEVVGAELYGGDIPVAAWDAPSMPKFATRWSTVCDRPGCGYLGPQTTFVLGARAAGDAGVWPTQGSWSTGSYVTSDDDGDGFPGITMLTRGPPMTNLEGRPYAYPPVGVASYGRARKLRLAMQLRVQLQGVLQTCDLIGGSSTNADVHVSAVGCTGVLDTDSTEQECPPEVAQFVDQNLPMWTVRGATFKMMRLPPGGGCYTARAILTQP